MVEKLVALTVGWKAATLGAASAGMMAELMDKMKVEKSVEWKADVTVALKDLKKVDSMAVTKVGKRGEMLVVQKVAETVEWTVDMTVEL